MENYHESIDRISQQIAEKDEELASLFEDVMREVAERNQESDNRYPEKSKLPKFRIEDIVNRTGRNSNINAIPGVLGVACHSSCLCIAFDKWQSKNWGFKAIALKVYDYWFSCSKINKSTLILSYAWDDIDFNEIHKKRFDSYTIDPQHTIAVILISSRSISLQYLN